MSNDNEQIIEDVEEKDLVENQELEAEGTEEVSEEIEVTEDTQELSDAVLEVLLGEAKKKNEAEESEEESEVEEDEELEETKKDKHEGEDQSEEEEVEEAYNEKQFLLIKKILTNLLKKLARWTTCLKLQLKLVI